MSAEARDPDPEAAAPSVPPPTRLPTSREAPPQTRVWLALSVVYVFWGGTYLAIKVAERTIPPLLMASIRFLIAGAALYLWSVARGEPGSRHPSAREWGAATVVGAALLLGGNGGVVLSERLIPSGLTALLVATVPLWMVLIGKVFLKEKLAWREAFGLGLGFAGLAWLVGFPHGHTVNLAGVLLVVGAALAWAAGSLYARKAPTPPSVAAGPGMQMLAGGVLLGIVGIASGELGDFHLARVSGESLLATGYLIVFGSIVAFSAYAWLIRKARTSLVATYAYVNPVVAVLLGAAILGESLTVTTLLAGLVILTGVALIVSARPNH